MVSDLRIMALALPAKTGIGNLHYCVLVILFLVYC